MTYFNKLPLLKKKKKKKTNLNRVDYHRGNVKTTQFEIGTFYFGCQDVKQFLMPSQNLLLPLALVTIRHCFNDYRTFSVSKLWTCGTQVLQKSRN